MYFLATNDTDFAARKHSCSKGSYSLDERYCVWFDARLDNQAELRKRLKLKSSATAEILVAAYQAWGERCPEFFLGDFAFVILDRSSGTCFAARDHLGIKPLFYRLRSGGISAATDIASLIDDSDSIAAIDHRAVGNLLLNGEHWSLRDTMYLGIHKLPPGCAITHERGKLRSWQFWDIEAVQPIKLANEQEYCEALREQLEAAVACRLGGGKEIAAHLSGGLDSSAIVALWQRQTSRLARTYSWLPSPERAQAGSASEYEVLKRAADHLGIVPDYTDFLAEHMLNLLERFDPSLGDSEDLWYEHLARRDAEQSGVSAVLSGWGGDQFITYHAEESYAASLWGRGKVGTLRDAWARAREVPSPMKARSLMAAKGLLGVPAVLWYRQSSVAQWRKRQNILHLCTPAFREYLRLEPMARTQQNPLSIRSGQLYEYRRGSLTARIEGWAIAGAAHGVEYRYPLLDKRVVEFALGMPERLFRQHGFGRYLFRQAVRDLLPEEICWRSVKYEPVRVSLLTSIVRRALLLWAEKYPPGSAESPFIDETRLRVVIQKLASEEKRGIPSSHSVVFTAAKAILVINIGSGVLAPLRTCS